MPPPDNDTLHHSRNFPERSYDGMDTLEELADKERFFNKLAVDVSGTLDFAKLNQALDEIPSDQEKRLGILHFWDSPFVDFILIIVYI